MSYTFLQQYWWFIVSLLGALLVFLLFVQGANSLVYTLGSTEDGQRKVLESTGRKWEIHVYDPRHLWRCVLRLLPLVLQYEFWRGLLALDDHPLLVRAPGREL